MVAPQSSKREGAAHVTDRRSPVPSSVNDLTEDVGRHWEVGVYAQHSDSWWEISSDPGAWKPRLQSLLHS